ncbi:hypothetical protein B0T26DRAFT_753678 [Lasiosphaeria miniovina]|uniref:Uncharacterized protein n=1 Tax=Lasiosphaeria miniovina TaxID=1954250 RepID=A0AA40AD58_9PEZI|nr:uncharacterized protein B0T26DRAFT_753678 [Lasiosphaeria miniovina]KAK0713589.1 hypothetical protein B0T26DRAFT_753678 [Lasiosphaeria miniovina]
MAPACIQCDTEPAVVRCSCGKRCCEACFHQHVQRRPIHFEDRPSKFELSIKSTFSGTGFTVSDLFKKDEPSKWFGLVADGKTGASGGQETKNAARIVVTPRFEELVDLPFVHSASGRNGQRQRPRLVSFFSAGNSPLDEVQRCGPRLLYMLSGVVCMVTANPRTSSELAKWVLDWGIAGAQAVVSQETLRALIIISNKTDGRAEAKTATDYFFEAVDAESNNDMEFAKKNGASAFTALKLAKDGQSAANCLETFELIVKGGFSRSVIYSFYSWWASWFDNRLSYFSTSSIREALPLAYRSQTLLGIKSANGMLCSSLTRVAVTTTVDNGCRLLTTYCVGDGQRYLGSSLQTYEAAQAASALPFYFEPFVNPVDKTSCRDGGLCATHCTSSVPLAESRAIWGTSPKLDLLLSLGPGSWPRAAKGPDWLPETPKDLVKSLRNAIKNVDGEEAWDRFLSKGEGRASRADSGG